MDCARYCQFDAIETVSYMEKGKEKKQCRVIPEKCFGCGICESKCKKENITLVLAPEKGIPLDVVALAKESGQLPRASN